MKGWEGGKDEGWDWRSDEESSKERRKTREGEQGAV
jgi:hypothetical protein